MSQQVPSDASGLVKVLEIFLVHFKKYEKSRNILLIRIVLASCSSSIADTSLSGGYREFSQYPN
jgi:hypothetical protein